MCWTAERCQTPFQLPGSGRSRTDRHRTEPCVDGLHLPTAERCQTPFQLPGLGRSRTDRHRTAPRGDGLHLPIPERSIVAKCKLRVVIDQQVSLIFRSVVRRFPPVLYTNADSVERLAISPVASPHEQSNRHSSQGCIRRNIAVAALLFCLPPLTWTATGLLAGWLAARRGKSWRGASHSASSAVPPGWCWRPCRAGAAPRRLGKGMEFWSRPRQCGSVRPDRLSGRHAERTMLSGAAPPSACSSRTGRGELLIDEARYAI